jgi:hypothetical protein
VFASIAVIVVGFCVSLKDVMTISSIACQIRSAFVLQKNPKKQKKQKNKNNFFLKILMNMWSIFILFSIF